MRERRSGQLPPSTSTSRTAERPSLGTSEGPAAGTGGGGAVTAAGAPAPLAGGGRRRAPLPE
eukprot:2651922-Pyramimonas_sp.AAC.1